MAKVFHNLRPRKLGQRVGPAGRPLCHFLSAATTLSKKLEVCSILMEVFGNTIQSSLDFQRIEAILSKASIWLEMGVPLLRRFFFRAYDLPLYNQLGAGSIRGDVSCIKCGLISVGEVEDLTVCLLCQGHLCENCDAGFYDLDDNGRLRGIFFPGNDDDGPAKLCPLCYVEYTAAVALDRELVAKASANEVAKVAVPAVGDLDELRDEAMKDWPIAKLAALLIKDADLSNICLKCGKPHCGHSISCKIGSSGNRGYCPAQAQVCGKCLPKGAFVCGVCRVTAKPHNMMKDNVPCIGEDKFPSLPPGNFSLVEPGSAESGSSALYLNNQRQWEPRDFQELPGVEEMSHKQAEILLMEYAFKDLKKGIFTTREAWNHMVRQVKGALHAVQLWGKRIALHQLSEKTRKPSAGGESCPKGAAEVRGKRIFVFERSEVSS